MQDPNADTEWNDILRQKGILPQKEKVFTEDELVNIVEETVQSKISAGVDGKPIDELTLDELDLLDDDDDEDRRILAEYRQKRMAEMKFNIENAKFGDVREISAVDYVDQVNNAGPEIWVVLFLYKPGIPLCTKLSSFVCTLAAKFPATKFLKSVSDTCIPNFPDHNLPAIFIYYEGKMKKQLIGPEQTGGENVTIEELEWMISATGAIETDLEECPRKKVRDVLMSALGKEDDDW